MRSQLVLVAIGGVLLPLFTSAITGGWAAAQQTAAQSWIRSPSGSPSRLQQEAHIFEGSQRRVVLANEVESSPFNAVLKLRIHRATGNRLSECTGFAVDRSIVVTAAHCIHSDDPADKPSIEVLQGLSLDARDLPPADPGQVKQVSASVYYDGYPESRDCAVLTLQKPLPSNVTPFELDAAGAMCARASHLETAGYTGNVLLGDPAWVRDLQTHDPDCHDRTADLPAVTQRLGGTKMITDCSEDRGASGSPLFCSRGDKHYVVGVFVAESGPVVGRRVAFGQAWNVGEKIASCAKQVAQLKSTMRRAAH
jgi:V8-like Glu-specific endopeptidase